MNDWMNEFLTRCLDGVPEGSYRNRTEKELTDHLLELLRDLERAGYAPEEARSLAQARMGDPAELARRYLREWRRRTVKQRALVTGEQLLVGTVMVVMAFLYFINTANFGKPHPALWPPVAIPAVCVLLCASANRDWTLARWTSMVILVIQLPPILCWVALGGPFEMSGMMVPGWLGSGLHLLFFAWGMFNYHIAAHFQEEENILSKAQSE